MNPERELALHQLARERRGMPFEWGRRDCNTLALEWLDMLTGGKYADQVIGHYSSEAEAIEFCKGFGMSFTDLLIEAGAERIKDRFEQTGDFLVVNAPGELWQRVHVCMGDQVLSVEPSGVTVQRLRMMPAHETYRVRV